MQHRKLLIGVVLAAFVASAVFLGVDYLPSPAESASSEAPSVPEEMTTVDIDPAVADTATFAGGCFWCMEPPYDKIDGVEAMQKIRENSDVPVIYLSGSADRYHYERAKKTGFTEFLKKPITSKSPRLL